MRLGGLRETTVRLRAIAVGILVLPAVLVAGCGGGDSSDASAEPAIPTSPPELEAPDRLPPKKIVVKDLRKGTGTQAKRGDSVKIQYHGILWGGEVHSSSWTYPAIPVFNLSDPPDARLLRGLNVAIPGMREGGSREVLIPQNFVFYPGVSHPELGFMDSLLYRVYLVEVLPASRPSNQK